MNALDSLLRMAAAQQADELRLGVARAPLLLAQGLPKNLTLAETGEMVLRKMLGSLLSSQAQASLSRGAPFSSTYEASEALGTYRVEFSPRPSPESGFDVTFRPGAEPEPEPEPEPRSLPTLTQSLAASANQVTPQLEALLARAARLRASDVHVRQGESAFARVDGRLVLLQGGAHDVHSLIGHAAQPGSSDSSLLSPSAGRIRLHAFVVGGVPTIAARILPASIPTLADLGLPSDLQDLAALPNGLVLITGPAGSGKSTTAAALCQELIRRRSAMLLTLEDPVEYTYDTTGTSSVVRQRQIGSDVVDFATGLRDALREDPDVLLVGEMRDPESIALALTAAETGHLVLGTLHSRSAASAIDRIIDNYPGARQQQLRVQLSESLRAVIAQRLLPHARGTGRVVAVEVLRRTSAVANLIREAKTPQLVSVMQSSRKEGMVLLERSLAELIRAGLVGERDAFAAANDQDSLSEYIHARGRV
ncbi:MAG: PilT/PilU family type 4a pilus ATPase [Polyangiaceae bacterium]